MLLSLAGDIGQIAYTNNVAGVMSTTLFGIDHGTNKLVRIGGNGGNPSPNGGAVTEIGPLNFDTTAAAGFDIFGGPSAEVAYAALTVGGAAGLYTINLTTGAASFVGPIGNGSPVINDLAGINFDFPAPVTLVDAKTVTFTDVDGDLVTVKTTKGTFTQANFTAIESGIGAQLQRIDLLGDQDFKGANLAITAKRSLDGGDGFVNIGFIDGANIDIGKIVVPGDLGAIAAGDSTTFTTGLVGLTVQSLGGFGSDTQGADATLVSNISGKLGSLTVKGDINDATVHVSANSMNIADSEASGIGSLTILGTLIGGDEAFTGSVTATGSIGTVKVLGDLHGGAGVDSGAIFTNGNIKNAAIAGSLSAGVGSASGSLFADKGISSVKIGGSVNSGTGRSGSIASVFGSIGNLSIAGSLEGVGSMDCGILANSIGSARIGGDINHTTIQTVGMVNPANTAASVALKNLTVGGSVRESVIAAGAGLSMGFQGNADVQIGSVTVNGNWIESSLAAGIFPGMSNFGDGDDSVVPNGNAIVSRIAGITVKGYVAGTVGGNDIYAFTSEEIVRVKVGGVTYPLTKGAHNDGPVVVGSTGDVVIREL